MATKMHADQADVTVGLVERLIAGRFPDWAGLSMRQFTSHGTDNAIFRLGEDMAVRMPLIPKAAEHIGKEFEWMPKLAPHLPLPIPVPIAKGEPDAGYESPWYVFRWLEGKNAVDEPITDLSQAATDFGNFVTAMQRIDASGAPATRRGQHVAVWDEDMRKALGQLYGDIYTDLATKIWERVLAASAWQGEPRWFHGDLLASNVLVTNGKLSAIIDFGTCGAGDPASDLMVAWTVLDAKSRQRFRDIVQPDDATWLRGKGWALRFGLLALPYYRHTNPIMTQMAKQTITEVLAEG